LELKIFLFPEIQIFLIFILKFTVLLELFSNSIFFSFFHIISKFVPFKITLILVFFPVLLKITGDKIISSFDQK
jgi:hypothetical protein